MSEASNNHTVWRNEVHWTLITLKEVREQRDADQKAVDAATERARQLEYQVRQEEAVVQVLRQSMVWIVLISAVIIFTRSRHWSNQALWVLLAWGLFCGAVSLWLILSSTKLQRLKRDLAKAQFEVDGYTWRLGRSEETVESVEARLIRLRQSAPDEYDEIQASVRN